MLYLNPLKGEKGKDGYIEIENEESLYNEDGIALNAHRLG